MLVAGKSRHPLKEPGSKLCGLAPAQPRDAECALSREPSAPSGIEKVTTPKGLSALESALEIVFELWPPSARACMTPLEAVDALRRSGLYAKFTGRTVIGGVVLASTPRASCIRYLFMIEPFRDLCRVRFRRYRSKPLPLHDAVALILRIAFPDMPRPKSPTTRGQGAPRVY